MLGDITNLFSLRTKKRQCWLSLEEDGDDHQNKQKHQTQQNKRKHEEEN